MDGACAMGGGEEKSTWVIMGNLSDRDHLEDQAYIQQDNITMGGIGWINVALVKKDVGALTE